VQLGETAKDAVTKAEEQGSGAKDKAASPSSRSLVRIRGSADSE